MFKSLRLATFFCILMCLLAAPIYAQTSLSGTVFQDYNSDGQRTVNGTTFVEAGVENVTVTAYAPDGTVATTATTNATGQYTLNLPPALDGERVRLEFTNFPNNLQPGIHDGTSNNGAGTSVRFITGGGTVTADLSLTNVGTFCGTGNNPQPDLVTSCFVFGDQTGTQPTVIQVAYNATGNNVAYTELANAAESGSVYGFGYHNPTNVIFFTNYVRRHAGTTPNGGAAGTNLDTLYAYNRNTDTLTTIDMGALGAASFGTDGRTAGWNFIEEDDAANSDVNNWDMVGKVGAGDTELSSDGNTLYVTNLSARRVEVFNVDYGSASATTGFTPGALTLTHSGTIGPFNPGCVSGVARPFGLTYRNGQVYIGVVCTAEAGGTADNLTAHVYAGATLVFSMNLRFAATQNHRGCVGQDGGGGGGCGGQFFGDWNPWSNTFGTPAQAGNNGGSGFQVTRAEPILSDIEFDNNGDMMLGFRDRFADQVGYASLSNPGSTTLYASWSGGDLIRVCDVGGTFVLEGDASGNCPQNAPGNNDGPNGGEFYPGDNSINFHGEAMQGALVQVPGRTEVASSFLDPTNRIFSGGFRRISNITGASGAANGAEIFNTRGGGADPGTAGKGNGMGDIEALCPPAPLEIGNLVWIEDIADGVQGTGTESTQAGILVELIDSVSGNVIAQATTDATGHYYFNGNNATWDTNGDGTFGDNPPLWDLDADGIADPNEPRGIMPFTNYTVRVASSNFDPGQPLENLNLTAINVGTGAVENTFRTNDSEALSASITTGAFGVNNHTVDFGFTPQLVAPPPGPPGGGSTNGSGGGGSPSPVGVPADLGDLPDSFQTTQSQDGARHPIVNDLRLGDTVDDEGDGQPSIGADGDGGDEDGVTFGLILPGQPTTVTITATNNTGQPAYIQGWIDLNGDGRFDINEQVATNLLVPDGTNSGVYAITVLIPSNIPLDSPIYSRFRLSTSPDLNFFGSASDGEVEDYVLNVIRELVRTGEEPSYRNILTAVIRLVSLVIFVVVGGYTYWKVAAPKKS
jgi:hypothetical protein